jgi:transcriptional regulator MraZ
MAPVVMFRGSHLTRLDDKGRLKMPAEYKRLADEKYSGSKFYITSKDGKSAYVYPIQEWEAIERKLVALPSLHPSRQRLLKLTSYYGQEVEFDNQGRLLLPAVLRESAGLKGEVSVGGRLTFLEVQNAESLRDEVAQPLSEEDVQTLADLGI